MSRWKMCVMMSMTCVVAACTGTEGSNDLHLVDVSTTSTTVVVETTSVPPTTVPETTTTVEPTTTTEPATTIPSPPETAPPTLEEQVTADFLADRAARDDCAFEPEGCNFGGFAVPGSPFDDELRDAVASRIRDGLRAKRGIGDVIVRVESVGFEGESAFVTSCVYDTLPLYQIGDPLTPDDDAIYNEDKNSYRNRWELRQVDGRWLFFDGTGVDGLTGGDLCGF